MSWEMSMLRAQPSISNRLFSIWSIKFCVEIFKIRSFLQSKSVNDVYKLLQLLGNEFQTPTRASPMDPLPPKKWKSTNWPLSEWRKSLPSFVCFSALLLICVFNCASVELRELLNVLFGVQLIEVCNSSNFLADAFQISCVFSSRSLQ